MADCDVFFRFSPEIVAEAFRFFFEYVLVRHQSINSHKNVLL